MRCCAGGGWGGGGCLGKWALPASPHPQWNPCAYPSRPPAPVPQGHRCVVAYASLTASLMARTPSAEAEMLKGYMRSRLPEHLVPLSMCVLNTLPLSPGGQIDDAALPPPILPRSGGSPRICHASPQTKVLCSACSGAAGVPAAICSPGICCTDSVEFLRSVLVSLCVCVCVCVSLRLIGPFGVQKSVFS